MVKKHPTYKNAWYALALTRILMGFLFLWAFLDKAFGLGFATSTSEAWVAGGSPTITFLTTGVNLESPFASMYSNMAGQFWVDWLYMFGMLGLGVSLILGVGLRIAAVGGTVLLLMMYLALIPLKNNPVVDEHIIYIALLWVFALTRREWSVTDWWLSQAYVKRNSWLW
jgi:thiosulfate dehydrogenase [quinone] large subunit